MRRTIFASAIAGATLLAGSGSAIAQTIIVEPPVGVYIAPASPYYDEYYAYSPGPRDYRHQPYFRDADQGGDVVVVRPRYRGGCGAYAYWDGDRCIDARY